MIYKQFQDLRLSSLGLGMMRLPVPVSYTHLTLPTTTRV